MHIYMYTKILTTYNLTLSLSSTTKVPFANSLNPDETPSVLSGSKLFDYQTAFLPILGNIEAF